MTDKELMQQALDYLERHAVIDGVPLRDALRERLSQPEQEPEGGGKLPPPLLEAALRQTLEALDQFIKKELTFGQRYTNEGQQLLDAHAALSERLAQPEQEPVKFNCTVVDDDHPEGVPLSQWGRQLVTEAAIRGMCERVPDYDISTRDLIQFARAIERAHGIKEQP